MSREDFVSSSLEALEIFHRAFLSIGIEDPEWRTAMDTIESAQRFISDTGCKWWREPAHAGGAR